VSVPSSDQSAVYSIVVKVVKMNKLKWPPNPRQAAEQMGRCADPRYIAV
jgi:hypothetical protein